MAQDDKEEERRAALAIFREEWMVQHGYCIPDNSKGGDYTGKCWKCGSKDLWDDNLSYGCNSCGMIRIGS